jgi:NifU-like protein involved in Fe-S cluster formation
MDEVITEQYRKLMQEGFKNAGEVNEPTMFIDTKAEGVSICGQGSKDFMNIYLKVTDGVISEVKYLCMCDPTANVVVEALCELTRGKTIDDVKALTKEQFFAYIGSSGGNVYRKVWGTIELINRVIKRWEVKQAELQKT